MIQIRLCLCRGGLFWEKVTNFGAGKLSEPTLAVYLTLLYNVSIQVDCAYSTKIDADPLK